MAKDTTLRFTQIGQNVKAAVDGSGNLILMIAATEAVQNAARPSSTGKTRTLGTTNGFKAVDGLEGVRVSLNVSVPPANTGMATQA